MSGYTEVSRHQIGAFLARAINRGAVEGLDEENGFRVRKAEVTENNTVRFDLDNGDVCFIDVEHLVPRGSIDTGAR